MLTTLLGMYWTFRETDNAMRGWDHVNAPHWVVSFQRSGSVRLADWTELERWKEAKVSRIEDTSHTQLGRRKTTIFVLSALSFVRVFQFLKKLFKKFVVTSVNILVSSLLRPSSVWVALELRFRRWTQLGCSFRQFSEILWNRVQVRCCLLQKE